MRKLTKSDVQFNVGKQKIKFAIIHNMPLTFGLSFNDAMENWLVRTNIHTPESLVKYIKSKNTGVMVMTEEEYKGVLKNSKTTKI